MSRGSWYDSALAHLQAAKIPLGLEGEELERRVREAYPWGQRSHWPYKAWLRAVRDWKRDRQRLRAFTMGGGAMPQ